MGGLRYVQKRPQCRSTAGTFKDPDFALYPLLEALSEKRTYLVAPVEMIDCLQSLITPLAGLWRALKSCAQMDRHSDRSLTSSRCLRMGPKGLHMIIELILNSFHFGKEAKKG
jgi:hypothetical protein